MFLYLKNMKIPPPSFSSFPGGKQPLWTWHAIFLCRFSCFMLFSDRKRNAFIIWICEKMLRKKKNVWGIIPSPTIEQIHFPVRAFKTIFTKNARFSPLFPERVISRGGKNNQKGCQESTLFVLLNDLVWDYARERRYLRRPKAADPPGAGVVSSCEPPESSGRAVGALPLRHLSGPVRIFYKQCTKDQMKWGPHACDLSVLEVEAGGSEVQGHP